MPPLPLGWYIGPIKPEGRNVRRVFFIDVKINLPLKVNNMIFNYDLLINSKVKKHAIS